MCILSAGHYARYLFRATCMNNSPRCSLTSMTILSFLGERNEIEAWRMNPGNVSENDARLFPHTFFVRRHTEGPWRKGGHSHRDHPNSANRFGAVITITKSRRTWQSRELNLREKSPCTRTDECFDVRTVDRRQSISCPPRKGCCGRTSSYGWDAGRAAAILCLPVVVVLAVPITSTIAGSKHISTCGMGVR